MLGSGSYLTLCPRNDLILTQDNTDNKVTHLKSGVHRGFTASLVSIGVLYTVVDSMAL